MNTKIKKNLAQILFIFSLVCLINSSVLEGMKKKSQETTDVVEYQGKTLLDLPDELLVLVVFFMFGGNHGKAILTMSLVCKEMHEKIIKERLYEKLIPGLKGVYWFIGPQYKKNIPRESFYLIARGVEVIGEAAPWDNFLKKVAEKGYLELKYLLPAYGIAKKGTGVQRFLYLQADKLLCAFGDEIDANAEEMKTNGLLWDQIIAKKLVIGELFSDYWCLKPFARHVRRWGKKLEEITFCSRDLK